MDRSGQGHEVVGTGRLYCPVAKMEFREGGTSLVCMRAPKEFGGQDMYSTWTYTKIVPMREIEYLHHFADKDGNRVDPAQRACRRKCRRKCVTK